MLSRSKFLYSWPVVLLLVGLLFGEGFHTDRLLFRVKEGYVLPNIKNGRMLDRANPLYGFLQKYPVLRLEPWLKSADESDVYGNLHFNRIIRVVFKWKFSSRKLRQVAGEFLSQEAIRSAIREPLIKITMPIQPFLPDDPYFDRQWYLKRIMADYAWPLWPSGLPTDSTVLVGVVDTGIDYLHPDIQPALYINPGEDIDHDGQVTAADFNGLDDDGNGFVDDIRGWDFAGADASSSGDNDIRPPSAGSYQILSHGTHVAGIMAAVFNNNLGISGIARGSRIIATKQSRDNDVSDGYLWDAYDGVLYCAKMGAKVINCSWGSDYYSSYADSLLQMIHDKYGSIVVCAAGNDNSNNDQHHFYPSDFSSTIAVAALNASDQKASFSNYGRIIDISAPGTSIYSTIHWNAGKYASWQGTSMASPVVAGSFALLTSWFPQYNPSERVDLLLQSADDISAENPGYGGLLGSGRVNVYTPIAKTIFPKLSPRQVSFQILDDDGDEQINPGEQVYVHIASLNSAGWQSAHSVQLTLTSSDSSLSFIDSTIILGTILPGDSIDSGGNDLLLQVSPNALFQSLHFRVEYSANEDSDHPYRESFSFSIPITLNQVGFPLSIVIARPLTVCKIRDSLNVILAIGQDHYLYALDQKGRMLDGFPVDLEGYTTMPPAIYEENQQKRIAIANRAGILKIIDFRGHTLLRLDVREAIYGNLSVADLDGDGFEEVVFGTMKGYLHILHSDGSELSGFPVDMGTFIDRGVALASLSDGGRELIFGTFDGRIHVFDTSGREQPGWPVDIQQRLAVTPVLLPSKKGYYVLAGTVKGDLLLLDHEGNILRQHSFSDKFSSPLAVQDLNEDGSPEVVFATAGGYLHVCDLTLKDHAGFPIKTKGEIVSSPVFGALEGKGVFDIIAGTDQGYLYVISPEGKRLPNFPARIQGDLNAAPTLMDVDGDGDAEIITGGHSGLFVFDWKNRSAFGGSWMTFLGNNQRTAELNDRSATAIVDDFRAVRTSFQLFQNQPNPFGNALGNQTYTRIRYNLKGQCRVRLSVYNILGQRIRTLVHGNQSAGVHRFLLDGTDLASGIYFLKLTAGGLVQTQKMMVIH